MKYFIICSFLLFFSCKKNNTLTSKDLRTGTFKTILDTNKMVSVAIRNDTMQVETYNGKKDTFYVFWKSDFEYSLKKMYPKNALDSVEFIVKITGIHKKSYDFKAYFKGSNYKQKGVAFKLED